jgi:23S rRNA (uridine2552-2'-O)-methyltransferase
MLAMAPLPGVVFIRGDFREDESIRYVRDVLAGEPVDLVLSDMAPNVSGTIAVDQPRMMLLCELALDMAYEVLKPGGALVVKAFQGEGFDAYLRAVRKSFALVRSRKPKSSRANSRELYLVATGYSL